ncbi:flagellar hook-associated protein FlgK [Massilia sp. PWRC2]|uniref:flagellar hook-associated protein FlgK n=1 Tax=Massilia sp. PWRC2 TaxID=2804626 RepID=UPI003CE7F586
MAGDLLNIGKSGLFAAQAGLATTGHNISNAAVPGYSRQTVVQAAATAQNFGYGFIGSGTQVTDIKRFSDSFLNAQVRGAQATSSALTAYGAQAGQIDNMLADTGSGLSPALQDFFKSVQDVSSSAGSATSRQAFLSSADSLASRFQSMSTQLSDINSGVNTQISANVATINAYATQIATLNEQIGNLSTAGSTPNDLIDTRDQLVLDLNKQVKATAVAGANNSVTVTIGSGQPLVVGSRSYQLAAVNSPSDPTRTAVAYVTGDRSTLLADSSLTGGELGGLMDFRNSTLDGAENALGRVAITLAAAFNTQQALGVTTAGAPGSNLFAVSKPADGINRNALADPVNPSKVDVAITDASKLTTSNYSVDYDAAKGAFTVIRSSDKQATVLPAYTQPGPQSATVDGVTFTISGKQLAGDSFAVEPTATGAANFKLLTHDVGAIAAAGPLVASATIGNKGSVKVGEASVSTTFLTAPPVIPTTLTYQVNTKELTGFATGQSVTVTTATATNTYTAGTTPIPYVDGATYSFGGVSLSMSGTPIDKDTFTIGKTAIGANDNRNILAMGQLQSAKLLDGQSATLQGAFAQMVSTVGNKTREVQVNNAAATASLAQATAIQQSVSGVNLDEEAANLLKYQQAYQAAGKVMQVASTLFDTLLSISR